MRREIAQPLDVELLTGRWEERSAGSNADRTAVANLLEQPLNDYGNGQRLIVAHGGCLRYCPAFKTWLVYTGSHWLVDRVDAARRLAQAAMLEFARQAMISGGETASKFAGGCLNSQRITAAMREAQPHLVVNVDQLDCDPYLLNFKNGTVDLRTGEIRSHKPEDLITKLVPHCYHPDAACPRFLKFMRRVLPRLEDYIQKALGYSLTAVTSEKAVFVCHGGGNNGKTTLLATVREVVGDCYAVLLQIDTLMARAADNNSQADLADLRGARFVVTSETEENQRLAEGRLKRITQGLGRIKAVRKYENPIEFIETHKLWMDCNHKPLVRGNDQALWNRLHLIPFDVTILAVEIDRELPAKLLAEAEGILAWMVEGSIRWHTEGLGKPAVVESAGAEWRSDMDQFGRFIGECCVVGDFAQAKGRAIYSAYRKWAEEVGEQPVTETSFGNTLKERGFTKKHTKHGVVYQGIGLASPCDEIKGDGC
jgi:putative DNA primase/helicase